MASQSERIVSLQILRFVAAMMVIWLHATCWTGGFDDRTCSARSASIGAAGVDVFFVLSGFVITLTGPLAARRPTGLVFFWRRWRRVAPIYYLLSLPFVAAAIVAAKINIPQLVATFLFWPATGRTLAVPYLGSGWTLGFEMIFYSAVSLALIGGRFRRNLTLLAVLTAMAIIARLFIDWNPLRILVNPIFLEFGAGVALALAWPRLKRAPLWIGLALVVAAVTAFAVQAVVGHGVSISIEPVLRGDEIGRVVAFGLPAAALVTGAAVLNRALAGRIVETAAWLGDASYSTYLTQAMTVPAVGAIALAIELRNRAAVELLAVLACMAFGAITYAVIEKPILRDLKRLGWDGRASARRMAVGGDPA